MAMIYMLDDATVTAGRQIAGDPDADELLQELREKSREDWIVVVTAKRVPGRLFGHRVEKTHALFCSIGHGEWQRISLPGRSGVVWTPWASEPNSREYIMNFMQGYVSCIDSVRARGRDRSLVDELKLQAEAVKREEGSTLVIGVPTFTDRGFGKIEFSDIYGTKCSIQKSSLATVKAVWFGPTDLNLQKRERRAGAEWVDVPLKITDDLEYSFNSRMHLDRPSVALLLPVLQHFVEHGVLP